jgi:hypothetical protein
MTCESPIGVNIALRRMTIATAIRDPAVLTPMGRRPAIYALRREGKGVDADLRRHDEAARSGGQSQRGWIDPPIARTQLQRPVLADHGRHCPFYRAGY